MMAATVKRLRFGWTLWPASLMLKPCLSSWSTTAAQISLEMTSLLLLSPPPPPSSPCPSHPLPSSCPPPPPSLPPPPLLLSPIQLLLLLPPPPTPRAAGPQRAAPSLRRGRGCP